MFCAFIISLTYLYVRVRTTSLDVGYLSFTSTSMFHYKHLICI